MDHFVKLGLFEIDFGHIYSPKMFERHLQFMGERKSFDFNNSPIMKLKADLSSKSPINSVMDPVNTQSKRKESKLKETKLKESKPNETKLNQTKCLSSFEKDQLMLSVSNWKLNKDLENAVLQLVEGMATPIQKDLIKKNKVKFEGIGVLQKVFNEVGM